MELKEGMYVRTKEGNIGKITFISPLDSFINLDTESYSIGKHFVDKASYNIIDLIEVGDYVNGGQVREKTNDYIRISGGELMWQYLKKEEDIKSIVTKEVMESMSYKVGE